jgi:hypothetical protein
MKFSELPLGFKVLTSLAVIAIIAIFSIIINIVINPPIPKITNYNVQIIDGCEYIVSGFGKSRTVTHKGNCKFCQAKFMKHDSIK